LLRAVPLRGDGASTRVYALETTTGYNDQAGPITSTDRSLDVAMKGNAWLAVQAPDGTEAYTRFGALEVNAEGTLVTKTGRTVLGDGGPIAVPANAELSIAQDGTISARQTNGKSTPVGKLKMVTPDEPLQRGDDALFRSPNGDLPADATARLQDGSLEGSNVSAVETMVQMIAAARQFETQIKMLQTAEKGDQQAAQLLSVNG